MIIHRLPKWEYLNLDEVLAELDTLAPSFFSDQSHLAKMHSEIIRVVRNSPIKDVEYTDGLSKEYALKTHIKYKIDGLVYNSSHPQAGETAVLSDKLFVIITGTSVKLHGLVEEELDIST